MTSTAKIRALQCSLGIASCGVLMTIPWADADVPCYESALLPQSGCDFIIPNPPPDRCIYEFKVDATLWTIDGTYGPGHTNPQPVNEIVCEWELGVLVNSIFCEPLTPPEYDNTGYVSHYPVEQSPNCNVGGADD